jgi:hypothetical protein
MKQRSLLLISLFALFSTFLPSSFAAAQDVQPAAQMIPGVQVVQSDDTGLVLELSTPRFTLMDVAGSAGPCQRVEVSGYPQAGSSGAPMLPTRVVLAGIPAQGVTQLTVLSLESETAAHSFHPCPGSRRALDFVDGEPVSASEQPAAPDQAIFGAPTLYPAQAAQLEELGFLRSQRIGRIVFHPFQVNPVSGELIHHRRLRVELRFGENVSAASASPIESGDFEQALAGLLVNYPNSRAMRTSPQQVVVAAQSNGWQPPANAFRVVTEKEGIYELSYSVLAQAGVPLNMVAPDKFHLYYNGVEAAIYVTGASDNVFGPGDSILFYGVANQDRYSRYNVYWLSHGGPSGLRMGTQPNFGSGGTPIADYPAQVSVEDNLSYVSSLPLQSGYDHWYGPRLTAVGDGAVARRDIPVASSNASVNSSTATLTLAAAGNVYGSHHVRIYVNGAQVSDQTWSGRTYTTISAEFDRSLLTSPQSTIRIELINDAPGQSVSMIYIDWLKLAFRRNLVAENDRIYFTNSNVGATSYVIQDFSTDNLELYDVTDPTKVTRIEAAIADGEASYTLIQTGERRYLAQSPGHRLAPTRLEKASVSDLLNPSSGADLIIITHKDFLAEAQSLAQFRTDQGVRVRVVDVQDVYDQFSFGRVSALAIRDFLRHAYQTWPAPAPAYVLLMGDGHYDLRGNLATSGPVYIPPFLVNVDPDLGETAADNRFVTVAGDDILPDMHIGRLPAETAADARAMVEKVFAYSAAPATDGWNTNMLFVTDNLQGGGGSFYNFSDAIYSGTVQSASGETPLIPEEYNRTRLYMGQDCPSESPSLVCQQQILERMNEGTLFVSYVGHGAKQFWAEEKLLTLGALAQLNNGGRLPVMLPMTCLEGYFHEPGLLQSSLGEHIVRMPVVGALASWSPTGFGLVTGHDYLERGFFLGLFHEGMTELGAATTYGKLYLLQNAAIGKYDDLVDTFGLLGDPMVQVRLAGSQPVARTHTAFLPVVAR